MSTTKEQRVIDIIVNGQKAEASLKDMRASATLMNNQLSKMTPGTKEFIEKTKELQAVRTRIGAVETQIKGVNKATGLMKQGFQMAMGAMLPMMAISKVFSFLDDSTKKFNTQAQAIAQMEATLKSTGHSASLTSQELQKMASDLQGKSLFGDEATIQAQALLLTFTDIKKGVFEDAMPAIADMAQKMAGDGPADLKGATIQVGKALNDPIKGISALSKVGVSFTAEQKATIKTLTDMGDKAGAQKLILEELKKEFGGSAEAARKAGTGGWTAFMNTVGDVQEVLGGGIAKGLNYLGNLLGEVVEKSDPLVAIFKEVWNELANMYAAIEEVVEGLGLFSSEGSMAETIVSALSFAFKIILTPIKLIAISIGGLVQGFKYLYNNFELVRGSVGGMGAAIKSAFNGIKNSAMNILGGVADLVTGIFTLDLEKIKSGLKKGFQVVKDSDPVSVAVGLAKSFNKGYQDNIESFIPDKVVKEAEKNADTVLQVMEHSGAKAVAVNQKQADKLRKAKQKSEQEDIKAQQAIEDLKLSLIEDSNERQIEKIKLHAQRKIQALKGSEEHISEQTKLILQQRDAEIHQLEEKFAEAAQKKKIAEEEAEKQRKKESFDKSVEELTKQEELERARLEQNQLLQELSEKDLLEKQFGLTLQSEQDRENALYELRKAALEARMRLIGEHHGLESIEYLRASNELMALNKSHNDQVVENEERTRKAKHEIQSLSLQSAKEALELGISFMKEDTKARKAAGVALKAFSIGKVLIDVKEEIAAIWKTANANPTNILFPGSGTVIAGLKTGLAVGRAAKSVKDISAQQFASGGFTSSKSGKKAPIRMTEGMDGIWEMMSGQSGGSLGSFAGGGWANNAQLGLIGEKGRELVLPNWMVEDPRYVNLTGFLAAEIERKGNAFAKGGMTATGPQLPFPGNQGGEDSAKYLQQVVEELRDFREEISTWQRELQVSNDLVATEKGLKMLNKLRDNAGIS